MVLPPQISERDAQGAYEAAQRYRATLQVDRLDPQDRRMVSVFDYLVATRSAPNEEPPLAIPFALGTLLWPPGQQSTPFWSDEAPSVLPFRQSATPLERPSNDTAVMHPFDLTFCISRVMLDLRDRRAA